MASSRTPRATLAALSAAVVLASCAEGTTPLEEIGIRANDGSDETAAATSDWSCLSTLTTQWTRPRAVTLGLRTTAGVQYQDALARVCAATDIECVRPLDVLTVSPDATAKIGVQSGWYGWDGRIEVSGNGLVPFLFSRIPAPMEDQEWVLPPHPFFAFPVQLAAATGIYPDPGRAMIGFQVYDCQGALAEGASVTVYGYAHAPSLYVVNDSPVSTATSTGKGGHGLGLIADLPAEFLRIAAFVEATGKKIAAAQVLTRPGALTVLELHPVLDRQQVTTPP